MSRNAVRWLLVASAGLVALLVLLWLTGGRRAPEETAVPVDTAAAPLTVPEGSGWTVELFFPGRDARLHAEPRELQIPDDTRQAVASVVAALLGGPESPELRGPLPGGTRVLGVWVDEAESLAWIDLGGEDAPERLSSGSALELMMVYSLVNTVALNVEGIDRVSLLWNGVQGESFAGHVDTTHPLRANRGYLARG